MVSLDGAQYDSLRDDVAAVFALGRNLSTDRVLISALVQVAVENILTSIIMENYYRFPADALDQLVAAFDSAPRRSTMAETIPTEHDAFYMYFFRKVEAMAAESRGNTDLFWSRFESFWNPLATEPDSNVADPSADRIKRFETI